MWCQIQKFSKLSIVVLILEAWFLVVIYLYLWDLYTKPQIPSPPNLLPSLVPPEELSKDSVQVSPPIEPQLPSWLQTSLEVPLGQPEAPQKLPGLPHNFSVDYNIAKSPSSLALPALGVLYRHQHPADCNQQKFIVWTFPGKTSTRNVGSIYTNIVRWFPAAFKSGRILVLDDRNWALADCPSKNSECYFEPITNCRIEYVSEIRESEVFTITDLDKQKFASLPQDKRVWKAPSSWWYMEGDLQAEASIIWPGKSFRHVCHLMSATVLYAMRPNKWLLSEISRKLNGSFPEDFDPSRAVGMPIRASDKCRGHSVSHSANGEVACSNTVNNYMSFVEKLYEFDPRVDTLLVSSEDAGIVQLVKEKNEERFKNTGRRWRILLNKGDIMQGSGSATYLVEKARTGEHSISDQVIAAMSSIHFQLRSRYLMVTFQSSFSILTYLMHMEDSMTFTDQRMRLSLFTSEVSVIKERSRPVTTFSC
mmetsp:Transcript_17142/g.23669  ORF Transcript_17142/g.23669 Transcript_17142/m.23669 type:complete len:478 (-) Transcript_17142:235-1668(-)